jgi:hypothetical protein
MSMSVRMGAVDNFKLLSYEPLRQGEDTKLTLVRQRIIICCDGTWQSSVKHIPLEPSLG